MKAQFLSSVGAAAPQKSNSAMSKPPAPCRTMVVGDVHGCGTELSHLLRELGFPKKGDRLIFVGDLFDRGPLPQHVLQTILEHQARGAAEEYSVESVCGNHDEVLYRRCRSLFFDDHGEVSLSRTSEEAIQTIDRAGMLEDLTLFLEDLAPIDTIRAEDESWSVVHAAIDPDVGVDATPRAVKLWHKAGPDPARAWFNRYDGCSGLIVCGHQHRSEPLVVLRDDRPVVVNVDTGCCYGNCLTAYVIEENRFVSVPAERIYYRERP